MGTVSSRSTDGRCVVMFDVPDHTTDATRLAAVVVWRGAASGIVREPLWRGLLHVFRRRLRRPQVSHRFRSLPDGFNGGASLGDPREVLFSEDLGVVRLLGRDYPLPSDGRTLLLLVDEPPQGPAASTVMVHALDVAPQPPFPRIDRSMSKKEIGRRIGDQQRAVNAAWHEAVDASPLVRSFLEGRQRVPPPASE